MDLRAGADMLNAPSIRTAPQSVRAASECRLGHRAGGTSLIEVLVTLTIVAVGLLGLLALQTRSAGWQRDSFDRKAAAELAEQLAERIRANHLGFKDRNYCFALAPGAAVTAFTSCAQKPGEPNADIALRDAGLWLADLRRRIPTAAANVVSAFSTDASETMLEVRLGWQEPSSATNPSDAACGTALPSVGWRCHLSAIFP